jgi:hypothetical protein
MARAYPRFIYSHVTNAKSPGHFIVHTLEPRCIGTIQIVKGEIKINPIDSWGAYFSDCESTFYDMKMWAIAKCKSGEIIL